MNVFDLVVQNGSVRQIQLVLENGIDINNRNYFSETLLMVCIRDVPDSNRRMALMKIINKFNPDINLKDAKGQTAFMYACIYEQTETVNYLLQQPSLDVNISDEDGFTAFMYACDIGNKSIVKLLIDAHVNGLICLELDKVNNKGKTALKLAIAKHFSSLFSLVNSVYSHKNYVKPTLCVPEDQESQLFEKVSKSNRHNESRESKSKKRLNLSLIKKALKEAYLSDEEDETGNKGKNEISEMMKALKECSSDMRQIYNEHEQRGLDGKGEMKTRHGKKGKHSNKGGGANLSDVKLEQKPPNDKQEVVREQISFLQGNQRVTINLPPTRKKGKGRNFLHPPPKGIHIEGLQIPTKQPEEGRKIVLSDTSNYDKKLAVKPSTSQDDLLYRRVRGTNKSSTLPLTINGRNTILGAKLPHRKVWSSMEPDQIDYHPPPRMAPGPSLQLPPLKDFSKARERGSPVKNLDRDMWKIVESYKS